MGPLTCRPSPYPLPSRFASGERLCGLLSPRIHRAAVAFGGRVVGGVGVGGAVGFGAGLFGGDDDHGGADQAAEQFVAGLQDLQNAAGGDFAAGLFAHRLVLVGVELVALVGVDAL